jgi:hypothetical protein
MMRTNRGGGVGRGQSREQRWLASCKLRWSRDREGSGSSLGSFVSSRLVVRLTNQPSYQLRGLYAASFTDRKILPLNGKDDASMPWFQANL